MFTSKAAIKTEGISIVKQIRGETIRLITMYRYRYLLVVYMYQFIAIFVFHFYLPLLFNQLVDICACCCCVHRKTLSKMVRRVKMILTFFVIQSIRSIFRCVHCITCTWCCQHIMNLNAIVDACFSFHVQDDQLCKTWKCQEILIKSQRNV